MGVAFGAELRNQDGAAWIRAFREAIRSTEARGSLGERREHRKGHSCVRCFVC